MNGEFMTRANSIFSSEQGRSTYLTENSELTNTDALKANEFECNSTLKLIVQHSAFASKYDMDPLVYLLTTMPSKYTYLMEAFPVVVNRDNLSNGRQVEELEYHNLFETVILRYTKSSQKPNPVLRDSRSSQFCYRLTVKVEAVPPNCLMRPHRFVLLREYLILQHLWESYLVELNSGACGPDQMIGFPMPFEFCNIPDTDEFQLPQDLHSSAYFNINGEPENIAQVIFPMTAGNSTSNIVSSLSYMSYERLGPSLSYLLDLMRSQNKVFLMSSALKVYDQIICRLMLMHKYGVAHSDPNPNSLFFGPGETCNVLYISEFGSAVVKPKSGHSVPRFHDRFVSFLRFREKWCHFAHDLESAFYVFLYLILGRLPWDTRAAASTNVQKSADLTKNSSLTLYSAYTDKSQTIELKEKFWQTQDILTRLIGMVEHEYSESLYQSFCIDVIQSLYAKTKEILSISSCLNPVEYMKEIPTPGSQVYNAYFGLRKIIVTYFRFENLSPSLRDTHAKSKIELLQKQCTDDIRMAWDLSHWCWNFISMDVTPRPTRLSGIKTK